MSLFEFGKIKVPRLVELQNQNRYLYFEKLDDQKADELSYARAPESSGGWLLFSQLKREWIEIKQYELVVLLNSFDFWVPTFGEKAKYRGWTVLLRNGKIGYFYEMV